MAERLCEDVGATDQQTAATNPSEAIQLVVRAFDYFAVGRLSRKCKGGRGKLARTCEQQVNKEEKLTLRFHRNLLILLGKSPLRQIISK